LAWPEPHTWFAAVIKSPSVISFLCLFSIRLKIAPESFPLLWGVHPSGEWKLHHQIPCLAASWSK
jgi:hypothetical protein